MGHWISSHLASPLQMLGGTGLSYPWQLVLGPSYPLTQEVSTMAVPASSSVRLIQLRLVVEPISICGHGWYVCNQALILQYDVLNSVGLRWLSGCVNFDPHASTMRC